MIPVELLSRRRPAGTRRLQSGFTLIELMVGVLLGLLTTLVIAQVLAFAEGQKRGTTSGSDAQVNGALALYAVQRDLQMAGYGFTANPAALGCGLRAQYNGNANVLQQVSASPVLAPVVITDGASDAPDTITVLASSKTSFALPIELQGNHTQAATAFNVSTSLGTAVGDLMVAVPPAHNATNWCSVFSVAGTPMTDAKIPSDGSATWSYANVAPASGYASGGWLINVGRLVYRQYSVTSDQFLRLAALNKDTADGSLAAEDLYPQVINMQAMYGKDTNGDGVVDAYNNATPTTAAGWAQVMAIRIAIVTRSTQYEKEVVTASEPLWDVGTAIPIAGTVPCHTSSQCLTLKVSQVGADWQLYRYKVYDTVVPLRNILWNS